MQHGTGTLLIYGHLLVRDEGPISVQPMTYLGLIIQSY